MDNLVPIVVALVGILIIFVLFKSINNIDVKVAAVPATTELTRKPRHKKALNRRNTEDELGREAEDLIAREIAKGLHNTGMNTDTKRIQPEVLERDQGRHQARALPKNHATANAQVENETPSEKDQLFKTVQYFTRPNKKKKEQTYKSEDDINQKMLNFFKNNKSQKSFKNKDNNVEEDMPQVDVGGHVLTYGALNMARTWNDLH
ncbi:unnamed protein product [Phytomonas sp. Hart1]|nr:unnamed protein product [Phytomonas sp. Hart1]|eukprot:CCW68981.1 unnamed protein product [Phytomonas sp. isolate Hart1]